MKNNIIVIIALAAIAGLMAYGYSASSGTKTSPAAQTQSSASSKMEKQTSDEGRVEVAVTPIGALELDAKSWDFRVSLNTHSVELSEDLAQVSVLMDERGREYRPLSWTGASPGGHHREGVLSFDPIKPAPALVKLEIRGVGGIAARAFSWKTAVK